MKTTCMVQILHSLSYKVCSITLPRFDTFGFFILILGTSAIIDQTACCYNVTTSKTGLHAFSYQMKFPMSDHWLYLVFYLASRFMHVIQTSNNNLYWNGTHQNKEIRQTKGRFIPVGMTTNTLLIEGFSVSVCLCLVNLPSNPSCYFLVLNKTPSISADNRLAKS